MKIRKSPLAITLFSVAIVLFWLLFRQSLSFKSLSDSLFLVCLPFLIIGTTQWLLGTQFFDRFHLSMAKAARFRKKTDQKFVPVSQVVSKNNFFYLKIALNLFIVSMACLFLYYSIG